VSLSLLKRIFPDGTSGGGKIYNLKGSSAALFLALQRKSFVAVEGDNAAAETLKKDIDFFRTMLSGGKVLFLPDRNGPESSGIRAEVMNQVREQDSLVTSSKNLRSALWDGESLLAKAVFLKAGDLISRTAFEESLLGLGYRKAPMVAEKGEFSRREWILDIFPSTSEVPLRMEFFGDEIETLKLFDVETQRSKEDVSEFLLLPASEPEDIRSLSRVLPGKIFYCLYPAREIDEFPEDTIYLSRYSFDSGFSTDVNLIPKKSAIGIDARTLSVGGLGILPDERKAIGELPETIHRLSRKHMVIMIASSRGQSERLQELFREKDIVLPVVDCKELIDFEGRISVTVGELSSGLFTEGLIILTERELFGERPAFRSMRRSKVSNLLVSMDDITVGDFVVHGDHGIGRFSGVVRQQIDRAELELMVIVYEDGRLYIPLQNIQHISKYRSEEGFIPKIDRLGGKTWQKKKERVRKKVHDMAERLLALYADRKVARGFSFTADTELHREFDSFFSYEETPDQLNTIEDIKKDMESDIPMDRLLCGDVGYGKTEVAMRAAFKAVYDGMQVAVLVPTTILAEQHYRTFRERFSGFPVTIDFVSRFKTKKQIESSLKGISKGEIDIIIGTHGLLSKKVIFNRLGLLIIDEEHRFGVGQKEKIKEMSKNIDVLTLTATPIPRTLHMALSGIRNISVIETPPEERLAVKSVVTIFDDRLITEATRTELRREGQVYFVHNRIHDIHKIAGHVKKLIPEAEFGIAHGRMPEKELEDIMHKFFEGRINVLVSTAIVGSGLDVPKANTIIINMADKIGLADLYQLRGRVGRSNRRGYAFFITPPESLLTEEARKRLQAVQEMSYLGAGFRLALKDLEIRGSGDLFGPEQSGHIHEIGFDLYIEMLEKAVAELKGAEIREKPEPVIELKTSAFIPEDYVEDITLRLSFYRRIAALNTGQEIEEFEDELRDRFGSPPAELRNLLKVMKLKILARELSITKIQEVKGKVQFLFSPDTAVQPAQVFDLHKKRKGLKFLSEGFEIDLQGAGWEKVFEEVYKALGELMLSTGEGGHA
jgi:transcription-repair coupling factor (superfamily II helicase)